MGWYRIDDAGLAVIPCSACGAPVRTPLDRLARDLMRGDTFCWDCNVAWRESRLHLKVDVGRGRVGFFVEPSVVRVVKRDVAVVEELEDRQCPVVVADVEPGFDIELDLGGGRRDLRLAVSGVDVVDLGVRASVGDMGDPFPGDPVVVVEASDASAGEGVGKAAQRGDADAHVDAVDLDVSVVQDTGAHDDSSSVGGDGAVCSCAAPSGGGASEPTEEAHPAPGRAPEDGPCAMPGVCFCGRCWREWGRSR